MTKAAVLALVPMLMATTAMAGPATQEGADHIVQVFQTYLGSTAGVISVIANGDTYALTIDVAPLMAKAKDKGGSGSMTPLEMMLTDNGDGTWGVEQDQALSLSFTVPNAVEVKEDVASIKATGVFDEKIMTFSSLKGEMSGLKVSETVTSANQSPTKADVALDAGTYEFTSVAGVSGVDTMGKLTFTGLTETIAAPMGSGQPDMPITLKAEGMTQDFKGTGFQVNGIYKTVAWFVSHPDQAAMDADKATLKTILTNALPIFGNINGTGKITKVSVDTPLGPVGFDEMGFAIEANGAVADGKVREAFSLSGLTLPPGIVPDWAAPILPKKVGIDVQVTDFDVAAPAALALGLLDLPDGKPGDDFNAKMQAALLPKGVVTITLNPGAVTGDGYELTYQGSMVAGPNSPAPTGKATITLAGIDKLQAALGNAPDTMKAQAMMGVGMAQGLAKTDADGKLLWEIDATTPGSVLINGTDVTKMGGQ